MTEANVATLSNQQLAEALRGGDALTTKPCGAGVLATRELLRRQPDNSAFRIGFEMASMFCEDEKHDYAAADRHYRTLTETLDVEGLESLGFFFADKLKDPDLMLARLEATAERNSGSALIDLDADLFFSVVRSLNKAGQKAGLEAFALKVARSTLFGKIKDRRVREGLADYALRPAIASGQSFRVPGLLQYISSPYAYLGYLEDRSMEPIWPFVDVAAGDGLAKVTALNLAEAQAATKRDPKDRDAFGDLVHALVYDGQFAAASALGDKTLAEIDSGEREWSEGDAWALNAAAYAFDAQGRHADGDRLFDALATRAPHDADWRVNFVINRATRLAGLGRWTEALEANALARQVADVSGTPYARTLVAATSACSLAKLGRIGDASADLAYARANSTDAPEPAAQALMCAGKHEEAAKMLTDLLGDPDHRDNAVAQLRGERFSLLGVTGAMPDVASLLGESDTLRAAYLAVARPVPDRFVPAAWALRKAP